MGKSRMNPPHKKGWDLTERAEVAKLKWANLKFRSSNLLFNSLSKWPYSPRCNIANKKKMFSLPKGFNFLQRLLWIPAGRISCQTMGLQNKRHLLFIFNFTLLRWCHLFSLCEEVRSLSFCQRTSPSLSFCLSQNLMAVHCVTVVVLLFSD